MPHPRKREPMTEDDRNATTEIVAAAEQRIVTAIATAMHAEIKASEERTNAAITAAEERTNARIEETETKLLTEFHKWASPNEARQRTHTAAIRAIDLELEAVSDRLAKVEGKQPPQ